MTEEQLKNIREKEEILNETEAFLKEAQAFLERWKNHHSDYKALLNYYYSSIWQEDFDASNRNEIPQGIPHGVLSEDAVFNTLAQQRTLVLAYLKYMVALLEE